MMQRVRGFFQSEEKIAWAIACVSLLFCLSVVVAVFTTGSSGRAAASTNENAKTDLLRQRMLLQARVNLCNLEKKSSTPVCDAGEQSRVVEYRKQIIEIDRKLGESM